jgi:RNA polymerase sigma factor (sigma-70 family)
MFSSMQSRRDTPDALEEAYQRYRAELRRFFELNSPHPQLVDDLMQMMYVQLLKARRHTEVRDPLQYLFRTAWNTLHSANRRARRERQRSAALDTESLWIEDDASAVLDQEELERVLRQLPRACQVAFVRQYLDGRSYKEIAEELGVTVHAVKKYLMRALNHFRIHFNSKGGQE